MSSPIKVISFDLDDTLWPCYPTIIRAEKKLYRWLRENVTAITDIYSEEQLSKKRQRLLHSRSDLVHDLTALRLLFFKQLAAELKIADEWVEPAFKIFYQARQQVTLYDDVKPVLDHLIQKFCLVSLTNGNADTVKTGVDHWFEHSISSIEVGESKSEPAIYRYVQKLINIDAHQMVHIGDDPVNDIAGAKKAGIHAVWLNRDEREWPLQGYRPDATINHLHQLPDIISKL